MEQTFVVLGKPRGQGRPRATKRGRFIGIYKKKEDAEYENNITAQIVFQKPKMISKEISVTLLVCFYFARPLSHYDSKGKIKERASGMVPIGKPDIDNCVKAVLDACNGIVWYDDYQITDLRAYKKYSEDNIPLISINVITDDNVIPVGRGKNEKIGQFRSIQAEL